MPKNEKSKKNSGGGKGGSREMVYKEDEDQVYGVAGPPLGDAKFMVVCEDGQDRLCSIRGSMKRGKINHVSKGDLVLVSLRGFQAGKADIVHRYTSDEVRRLKKEGYLTLKIDEDKIQKDPGDQEEDAFEFDTI